MLQSMQSQQERQFNQWLHMQNEEKDAILQDDDKCLELLQMEEGFSGSIVRSRNQSPEDHVKQVAELRKQYKSDIDSVVKSNFEAFERKFNMGINQLKDELSAKIDHQGDRVISALTGGPHKRIRDKVSLLTYRSNYTKPANRSCIVSGRIKCVYLFHLLFSSITCSSGIPCQR
jgi:hypothetical protein